MRTRSQLRILRTVLAVAAIAAVEIPAQQLGRKATEVLLSRYDDTENWATQALVLLSAGREFHPVPMAPVLLQALDGKDRRLHAYAVEVMKRTDHARLAGLATPELMKLLIRDHAGDKNDAFRKEVLALLKRMFPDVEAEDQRDWKRWWNKQRREWATPDWTEPPKRDDEAEGAGREGGGTVSTMVVDRAMDLNEVGLDLVITIDSTGSMQRAIDSARDAVLDLVEILQSIAPQFRLGLTHYKDLPDMGDGAEILEPLTPNVRAVRDSLSKLIASGGGDAPERVEKGMEQAFRREMGWSRDANKVVVVIGDAPAHPDGLERAVALAKQAHEDPLNLGRSGRPTTGRRDPEVRPYVISTIATNKAALPHFQAIAEAGGGTATALTVQPRGKKGSRDTAKNILQISFGPSFRDHVGDLVDIYFRWRDAELF